MKKLLFLLLFSSITYAQVYEKTTAVGLDSSVAKPSAVAKYGWVYRGTDNHLYWRTLNGTRMLDSSTSITIDSTNWQKYPDTLTWDATKKNLKDSTASLRTDLYRKDTHVTDSTNARNYSNSLYLKNADSTTLKNSINVAGTLSNVAYLNQTNAFVRGNSIIPSLDAVPLTLQHSNGSHTTNLFNAKNSTGTTVFSISPTGVIDTGSYQGSVIGTAYTTAKLTSVSNSDGSITVANGTTAPVVSLTTSKRNVWTNDIKLASNGVDNSYKLAFGTNTGDTAYVYMDDITQNIQVRNSVNNGVLGLGTYTGITTGVAGFDARTGGTGLTTYAIGDIPYAATLNPISLSKLSIGSSGTVLSSMAGQTVPTYNSKIFLYPSDSAFIVTSSIKNKNVASYVQQGDTSAFVSDFTTGTGKPQMRIKDPTGATTLYIDSTGQINGSEVANGDLTLQGTTNATRTTSYVNLQPNGGFVGIGTATPSTVLNITQPSTNDVTVTLTESATNRSTLFAFLPTGAQSASNPQWTMGTLYNDAANGFHFSTYDGATTRDRFSIDTASNMTFTGKVKTFNNIATEGYGVPSIIDTVYRTLQTASIAAFNVANSAVAGLYEVRYYIECTATGTGNTTVTVDWDNATKSVTSTACSHSATTNFQQGTISIYHAATSSTSIRLSTTCTTTGTYALRAWVKRIN